jgi:glycosyltransferase involved in cell wall biosynthesis
MKGISVLLAAAKELALQDVSNLSIEIYGDYSNQPIEFQKSVVSEIELASSNVWYRGPYDNAQVLRLMASVDAVLVPSIWWENSPVVIQEAFAARKPVLCSNIGGMAEKVQLDIDGFWFEAGDSGSLAQLLLQIARKPDVLKDLSRRLRPVPSSKTLLKAHLDAYRC